MKVKFFLPYYDYNDGSFDVSNDYYSESEYSKLVKEEYEKNKDIVYNSMIDAKNGSGAIFEASDGQSYKFGAKASQNEEKVAFSSCEGTLYNEYGDDETVDGFINKFARQEPLVEMLEFDGDTIEEEFETEMTIWVREHKSINDYKDKLGEEWVWAKEPQRNVKVQFKNNADQDVFAVLENCKIMNIVEGNSFILFIEKITIVNNI